MGRKERWEVGIAREASELDPSNLDTTTEAIEPGEELEWGTPTPNSTDKGDFLPEVHSFSSYPPECSTSEAPRGGKRLTGMLETIIQGIFCTYLESHSPAMNQHQWAVKRGLPIIKRLSSTLRSRL